jgi:hypothetical protein
MGVDESESFFIAPGSTNVCTPEITLVVLLTLNVDQYIRPLKVSSLANMGLVSTTNTTNARAHEYRVVRRQVVEHGHRGLGLIGEGAVSAVWSARDSHRVKGDRHVPVSPPRHVVLVED